MRIAYRIIIVFFLTTTVKLCLANNWEIKGLQIANNQGVLSIQIGSLQTPFFKEKLSKISYSCKSKGQIYPQHYCHGGSVSFIYEEQNYSFMISGLINLKDNQWKLSLSNTKKNFTLLSNSKNSDKFTLSINKMPLSELSEIVRQFTDVTLEDASALISADITIDTTNDMLIQSSYEIQELSWESSDGNYVLADNFLRGDINLVQGQQGFELKVKTDVVTGEGLFKDIYVLFDEIPSTIITSITFDNELAITSTQFHMISNEVVDAVIDVIDLEQQKLTIDFVAHDMSKLYAGYLASYFEIIGVEDLEVEGKSQGKISFDKGEIVKLTAKLDELYLEIASKKIELSNVNAEINWQNQGEQQTSSFSWDSLLLAGMPIQQSSLDVYAVGQQLSLPENTELPIFDGSLLVDSLLLKDIFEPDISIDFQGEVKPISLAMITEKMGWAIMDGSISGKIPGMKKVGQSITFDGVLDINVFGGQMQISKLGIERLFGIAPVIAGDITFEKLDMQLITSTFDFGEITGLISGYIKELRITNWKPDRLDAYIQSVKTKGIKQIISQRAIDNISSIGGIQGAVSRSFLRFFDNFKYKRIGIGCKLRNSICSMSGIKDSENNYTLIEGKGIPSINIMGFRKHIDWEVFLDRLLDANY